MREIKFRAWDIKRKKWISDFLINPHGKARCSGSGGGLGYEGTHETTIILMQFTGLMDRTGKEIYEGDIIKKAHLDKTVVVKFGAHASSTDYYYDSAYGFFGEDITNEDNTYQLGYVTRGEIIGNIYENKNLLMEG